MLTIATGDNVPLMWFMIKIVFLPTILFLFMWLREKLDNAASFEWNSLNFTAFNPWEKRLEGKATLSKSLKNWYQVGYTCLKLWHKMWVRSGIHVWRHGIELGYVVEAWVTSPQTKFGQMSPPQGKDVSNENEFLNARFCLTTHPFLVTLNNNRKTLLDFNCLVHILSQHLLKFIWMISIHNFQHGWDLMCKWTVAKL